MAAAKNAEAQSNAATNPTSAPAREQRSAPSRKGRFVGGHGPPTSASTPLKMGRSEFDEYADDVFDMVCLLFVRDHQNAADFQLLARLDAFDDGIPIEGTEEVYGAFDDCAY